MTEHDLQVVFQSIVDEFGGNGYNLSFAEFNHPALVGVESWWRQRMVLWSSGDFVIEFNYTPAILAGLQELDTVLKNDQHCITYVGKYRFSRDNTGNLAVSVEKGNYILGTAFPMEAYEDFKIFIRILAGRKGPDLALYEVVWEKLALKGRKAAQYFRSLRA